MRALHLFSPAHCLTGRFTEYIIAVVRSKIHVICARLAVALAWCVIAYVCCAFC